MGFPAAKESDLSTRGIRPVALRVGSKPSFKAAILVPEVTSLLWGPLSLAPESRCACARLAGPSGLRPTAPPAEASEPM